MIPLWKTLESELLLEEKDIHVWRAALDSPAINIQGLYQTLSIDERARAEGFHFQKDKNRFVVRRGMLRMILGCYLSVEPSRVRFCYGRHGKPKLADTSAKRTLFFNVSDSGGLALYAFSHDCQQIGVDIEHVRDIPEMDQIAEKFFTVRENAVFHALPKSKKKEAFFNCWTRKEAFIKAIGDGLSWPLDKFDVSLVPGEPARLLRIEGDLKRASRWSIQELKPSSGFVGAFAIERRSWQLHCWQW